MQAINVKRKLKDVRGMSMYRNIDNSILRDLCHLFHYLRFLESFFDSLLRNNCLFVVLFNLDKLRKLLLQSLPINIINFLKLDSNLFNSGVVSLRNTVSCDMHSL